MIKYILMHKDNPCGVMIFDEQTGRIISYKDNSEGLSPYLGNSDLSKIQRWWEMRAVPASRAMIQDIIRNAGCLNTELYLAKNLGLSMTDAYWVCPANSRLTYDQVKFRNFELYNDGKIPYHNATSYDYNASLGGQMEKYWDLDHDVPDLVKESSKFYGQQSVNEVVATRIHELQHPTVPFVKYTAEIVSGHGIRSHCDAFTSENIELISAYEIVESQKNKSNISLYDDYISICVQNGIDQKVMQDFMDYQTLTDFIISNTDEHLNNFGVLRDTNTMKLIGPAPIYDSGNSMFYQDEVYMPYSRAALLARPITSFYKTEDKMLAKVQNRAIVQFDLLPSGDELKELYVRAGIPEAKADFILKNYETKLQLVNEFQHGKTISLYHESESEKEKQRKQVPSAQKIMMLCGIPGSGKTKYAEYILTQQKNLGYQEIDSTQLYPVEQIISATHSIYDSEKLLKQCPQTQKYKNGITIISTNEIRKEIKAQGVVPRDNVILLLAKMRIKTALQNGCDVIYNAANISIKTRKEIIEVVKSAGITNLQLYIMPMSNKLSRPDINNAQIAVLKQKFTENYPTSKEGWSNIIEVQEEQKNKEKIPCTRQG